MSKPKIVSIIGAGFSGSLLAKQLQLNTNQPIIINIIERANYFATGAAYSTYSSFHLLNVRAESMSAFPDKPDDFVNFLLENPYPGCPNKPDEIAKTFAPRMVYQRYLASIFQSIKEKNSSVQLNCIRSEVIDVKRGNKNYELILTNHPPIESDIVVFATGNPEPNSFGTDDKIISCPWEKNKLTCIRQTDSVLIIGTGLTMVDSLLTLKSMKYQGKLYLVSRHGLLPQAHLDQNEPAIEPVTKGGRLKSIVKDMHKMYSENKASWRQIVDSIRPITQTIWQALTDAEKRQFQRHLQAHWDTKRHRVANEVQYSIEPLVAIATLIKGSVENISPAENQTLQTVINERNGPKTLIQSHYVINCAGPSINYKNIPESLYQNLLQSNFINGDAPGILTDEHYRVIQSSKVPHQNIYCIGPPLRGKLYESIAVPELRKQCADLAMHILNH